MDKTSTWAAHAAPAASLPGWAGTARADGVSTGTWITCGHRLDLSWPDGEPADVVWSVHGHGDWPAPREHPLRFPGSGRQIAAA
jgi:hypothetical protein